MTSLEKISECDKMTEEGQLLEAFEKFYHDYFLMAEATGEVCKGKDANREFEK